MRHRAHTRPLQHPSFRPLFLMVIACQAALPQAAWATTKTHRKVVKIEAVKKRYEKMEMGEHNIPSDMSVLTKKQIRAQSSSQSIYSILKQTPSVNEYQQNVGPGTPVLTIRGVRMSQLAQTLDGIPMISLLSGGEGAYLNNNIGSVVSKGQIEGVQVYPGVAPPDRQGFATVGGTIAYHTLQPSVKRSADLLTRIGSFNTTEYGIEANSGTLKSAGGLRLIMRLTHTHTAGYIENTPARYTDFLFSAVKPYDYGLSQLTGTLIYNRGTGYLISSPLPVAQLNKYGLFYNYPLSEASTHETNNFITAIVGDRTYINRHLLVGVKLFYKGRNSTGSAYTNPQYINGSYPYRVNFNAPYFGFGPVGGPNNPNNGFSYDPAAVFGSYQAGEAADRTNQTSTTIGITPKVNLFLPYNDITIGGLFAHERGHGTQYFYGTLAMPEINGYNSYTGAGWGGYGYRTVYSGYIQDKIGLLHKTLHVEPGITVTEVHSRQYQPINLYATPDYPYTLANSDRAILPYLGLSYDITRKIVAYASYGKGARFAPIADYVLGPSGSSTHAPGAETVNAYEAGMRYVGRRLYLNLDGFLQNMSKMFSFYINYTTGFAQYENIGKERMEGAEFSGKYLLTRHWAVSGNASYTRARYLNGFAATDTPFEGQFGYVFRGDPLAAVPNWLANLGLSYRKDRFQGDIIGQYTGSQVTTYDLPPTESNPQLQDATTPNPGNRLAGYFVLNVGASYRIPIHQGVLRSLKVALNIDNLLNNHYYVHYYQVYKEYGFAAVGQPYDSAYPGEPRFIEISLSGRFA